MKTFLHSEDGESLEFSVSGISLNSFNREIKFLDIKGIKGLEDSTGKRH